MTIANREIQDVTAVMVENLASPITVVTMVTLEPTFQAHHHNNQTITVMDPQTVDPDLRVVAARETDTMAAVAVAEPHLKHPLYLLLLNHLKDSLYLISNNKWNLLPTTTTVVETEDMKVKIEEAITIVAKVVVAMTADQAEETMAMVVIEEEAMTMAMEEEVVVRDKDKEIWVKDSSNNNNSSKVRVNKAKDKVVQKGKEEVKGNLGDMRARGEGRMTQSFLLLPSSSS